jgi:gas vesicle protein
VVQRSDELKSEIEQTREQMGETADALAYKADVPTRTREWIGEKKDAVVSTVTGATSKVTEVTPDGEQVTQGMGRLKGLAERNPLGLAIGGAAAGFIAGLVTPATRVEDERMGPMADEVKSTATEAGREALDRGKEVLQDVGESAMQTAKERASNESDELTENLQDKAREVLSSGTETAAASASETRTGRITP